MDRERAPAPNAEPLTGSDAIESPAAQAAGPRRVREWTGSGQSVMPASWTAHVDMPGLSSTNPAGMQPTAGMDRAAHAGRDAHACVEVECGESHAARSGGSSLEDRPSLSAPGARLAGPDQLSAPAADHGVTMTHDTSTFAGLDPHAAGRAPVSATRHLVRSSSGSRSGAQSGQRWPSDRRDRPQGLCDSHGARLPPCSPGGAQHESVRSAFYGGGRCRRSG
jgi:hypothetical protein